MSTHKVTLIPGDGIGPEVVQATVRMVEATGVKFEWESFAAGAEAFEKYHEYIPKELSESIERTRVGLKGPVTTPIGGGFSSINVELRKRFELFANFRPIRNLPHIPYALSGHRSDRRSRKYRRPVLRNRARSCSRSGREHQDHHREGFHAHRQVLPSSMRARTGRKKIHCIHKANIMKLSDGLISALLAQRFQRIS
jgi:isocitrate dehydrogenase (NAD+)